MRIAIALMFGLVGTQARAAPVAAGNTHIRDGWEAATVCAAPMAPVDMLKCSTTLLEEHKDKDGERFMLGLSLGLWRNFEDGAVISDIKGQSPHLYTEPAALLLKSFVIPYMNKAALTPPQLIREYFPNVEETSAMWAAEAP